MRRAPGIVIGVLAIVSLAAAAARTAEAVRKYVGASSSLLQREPLQSAPMIRMASRGESALVLEEKGAWTKVKLEKDAAVGWVMKPVLTETKPITAAELTKTTVKPEKISRLRMSSRAATMGVRGLTENLRARDGREQHRADYESVEKLERQAPDARKVGDFRKAAGLPQ